MTAEGHVVEGFLSAGNDHDIIHAEQLVDSVYGCKVLADRGYDSNAFRTFLYSQNCTPVIPGKKNRKLPVIHDEELYKRRGLIERIFGKIKENSRLSMRKEKSDCNFLAMIGMALVKSVCRKLANSI